MDEIGVFHDAENYGTFYTCCCRVKIYSGLTICPCCKRKVIPASDRMQFTYGLEKEALRGRWATKYMENRYMAEKVAARLEGKPFIMPALCLSCGNPQEECKCIYGPTV